MLQVSLLVTTLDCSRSFYGYATVHKESIAMSTDTTSLSSFTDAGKNDSETLYSLLQSLLPPLAHKYEPGCTIDKEDIDVEDECLLILASTLNALRVKAGWKIPKVHIMPYNCNYC